MQQVNPLIRELVHYRDLIQQRMQEQGEDENFWGFAPDPRIYR